MTKMLTLHLQTFIDALEGLMQTQPVLNDPILWAVRKALSNSAFDLDPRDRTFLETIAQPTLAGQPNRRGEATYIMGNAPGVDYSAEAKQRAHALHDEHCLLARANEARKALAEMGNTGQALENAMVVWWSGAIAMYDLQRKFSKLAIKEPETALILLQHTRETVQDQIDKHTQTEVKDILEQIFGSFPDEQKHNLH